MSSIEVSTNEPPKTAVVKTLPPRPADWLLTAEIEADLVSKVEYFQFMLDRNSETRYVVFCGNDADGVEMWRNLMSKRVNSVVHRKYPLPPIPAAFTEHHYQQYELEMNTFLHDYMEMKEYTRIAVWVINFTTSDDPQMHILFANKAIQDDDLGDWLKNHAQADYEEEASGQLSAARERVNFFRRRLSSMRTFERSDSRPVTLTEEGSSSSRKRGQPHDPNAEEGVAGKGARILHRSATLSSIEDLPMDSPDDADRTWSFVTDG